MAMASGRDGHPINAGVNPDVASFRNRQQQEPAADSKGLIGANVFPGFKFPNPEGGKVQLWSGLQSQGAAGVLQLQPPLWSV